MGLSKTKQRTLTFMHADINKANTSFRKNQHRSFRKEGQVRDIEDLEDFLNEEEKDIWKNLSDLQREELIQYAFKETNNSNSNTFNGRMQKGKETKNSLNLPQDIFSVLNEAESSFDTEKENKRLHTILEQLNDDESNFDFSKQNIKDCTNSIKENSFDTSRKEESTFTNSSNYSERNHIFHIEQYETNTSFEYSEMLENNKAVQKLKETIGIMSEMQSNVEFQQDYEREEKIPKTIQMSVKTIGTYLLKKLKTVAYNAGRRFFATVGIACIPIFLLLTFIIMIVSVMGGAAQTEQSAGHGLPTFVTNEMMEAFFLTQEESGIPVSTGVAQLIAESGFGSYGPGGDEGKGLSKLAYDYKNLFGIKYFMNDPYAIGGVDMSTGEQTESGDHITIDAAFAIYPDYKSCIKQRAWMLNRSPYKEHLLGHFNQNDGSYTIEKANAFAEGIKAAGWATSHTYVENLISIMEQYNLYQYDNMTYDNFIKSTTEVNYDGTVTDEMERIKTIAFQNKGIYPCDPDMCAQWVTGVYIAAGINPPPYGNAIDMWNHYKHTGSTDMNNIPPGAIVCGSGAGYMGSMYGHVGIYVGNGLVAHNLGRHVIEPLSDWSTWQTANCQGHVGWIGWVYPPGVPKSK